MIAPRTCGLPVESNAAALGSHATGTEAAPDHHALEALIIDNPDLERLEELLDQFNLFEALGIVRQELRHSDLLAFLLDPRRPNGLGDAFLKKVLQKVLLSAPGGSLPVSLFDLDVWSLEETAVLREWRNIDLLLLNDAYRLVVIIENKIDSGEESGQLDRYYRTVQQQHPGWRIMALYLTPAGDSPSDDRYLPISYRLIAQLIEGLVTARASVMGPDVQMLLRHYAEMLRRHIVSESEIDELCQRIYSKHRRALDLIYARRPDRQAEIKAELAQLIRDTPGLRLRYNTKSSIGFHPVEWDTRVLQGAKGESADALLLEFYFDNLPNMLRFKLIINTGTDSIRHRLFDMARQHKNLFRASAPLGPRVKSIYDQIWLTSHDLIDGEMEDLKQEIAKRWRRFIEGDLPEIREAVGPVIEVVPVMGGTNVMLEVR